MIMVHNAEAERLAVDDARASPTVFSIVWDSPRKKKDSMDQFDDISISGDLIALLRLERMADTHICGRVELKDGRSLELCFWAKRKVWAGAEADWDIDGDAKLSSTANTDEASDMTQEPLPPTQGEGT